MNNKKTSRLVWLDIAKGIAIILMIVGHADWIPSSVRGVIFSFHMPLFMIVNGYLISNYNIKETLKKSCNSLLKPYVIVCIIQAIILMFHAPDINQAGSNLFEGLNDMVLGLSKTSGILTDHGSVWLIWFVICLFFARNIYVAIMSVFSKKYTFIRYPAIVLVALTGYFIGTKIAFLPWSFDVAMLSVIFIAVGDILHKNHILERNHQVLPVCSFIIWVGILITGTYIELAVRKYPFVIIGVIEAIAGSIFILCMCKYTEKLSLLSKILSWYGEHSLLILAIHCIEMRFFNFRDIIMYPLGLRESWILLSVIRLSLISTIAFLLSTIHRLFIKWENDHFENCSDTYSTRLSWPDVSKGIAIICVIAGHMGINFINQLVFLWHLPVFFLLAGYFMNKSNDINLIRKKAFRLLVPYYITCFVICIIAAIRAIIGKQHVIQVLISWIGASLYGAGDSWSQPFVIKGIGAIWFLWALFIACAITNHFIESKYAIPAICIISFLGWGSMEWTGIWLPLSIQAGMLSSLYLLTGYYAKKKNISPSNINNILTISCIIIAALGIQHFKGFWLVHDYMGNGWIDFPVSICASVLIMVYSEHICHTCKTAKHILSFLGKNSLLILCLHIIDLDVLPIQQLIQKILFYIPISFNEISTICIIFLAKIAYVVIGTILLQNLSLIKKVFG